MAAASAHAEGNRHRRVGRRVTTPFGGSIPDEIVLTRDEAATVLLAIDDAVEESEDNELRARLEQAAQIIIDKFLPDLPDL